VGVALIKDSSGRSKIPTPIEDAMYVALAKALYDRRHPLHQRAFGYYRPVDGEADNGVRDRRLRQEALG
jgi:hypothetical protein